MTKKAHLIGICGAGMSAVAYLLQQDGYDVTGSDEGFYPPVSDYLTKIGLTCTVGHRPENIPDSPDLIIIGRHAKLVPETNPEVAFALTNWPDRVRSFPEVLGQLTKDRERIVVAGSYGKSTLTSLITWCLISAGKDPGWFIGAIPNGFDHSSNLGTDAPFIFEGDEYPSANFDDRPKFAHYAPQTLLLTSATHDHVNVYPTLTDYHRPFHELLEQMESSDGTLIACMDETHAANFFHGYRGPKISYGLSAGCNYSATHIELGDPLTNRPTTFCLLEGITQHAEFSTHALGQHAVENIAGAAACLLGRSLVTVDQFREGVASFSGLRRRLDRVAKQSALPAFEGFGSSLEKARAAIDAIKAHMPDRRLVIAFEPHTFTWRNRAALDQYKAAFKGADSVWVFAPPGHGSQSHDQASHSEILEEISQHHTDVHPWGKGNLVNILEGLSPEKDVLLVLSSGSFDGALPQLIDEINQRFAA